MNGRGRYSDHPALCIRDSQYLGLIDIRVSGSGEGAPDAS